MWEHHNEPKKVPLATYFWRYRPPLSRNWHYWTFCLPFSYKWTYVTDFSRIWTRIDTCDVTEHSVSLVKVQRTFFESCKGYFSQIDTTQKNILQSWEHSSVTSNVLLSHESQPSKWPMERKVCLCQKGPYGDIPVLERECISRNLDTTDTTMIDIIRIHHGKWMVRMAH